MCFSDTICTDIVRFSILVYRFLLSNKWYCLPMWVY
nr:MAG TPA: hypothetical protein [Caudoviricetes sp.]